MTGAESANPFMSGSLDAYLSITHAQRLRYGCTHTARVCGDLGTFRDKRAIGITHSPAVLRQSRRHVAKKRDAAGAPEPLVRIGIELTYVRQAGRAQKRIAKGVQYNVGVGMPFQSLLEID